MFASGFFATNHWATYYFLGGSGGTPPVGEGEQVRFFYASVGRLMR